MNVLDPKKTKVNTIFVLSEKITKKKLSLLPENKIMMEKIYIIFNDQNNIENLEKQCHTLANKRSLATFGIEPKIKVLNKHEFVKNYTDIFDKLNLWLYSGGKVNKFHKKITFSQWLDENNGDSWKNHFNNGIPPIVSNVKVNQDEPKTLKTKKEEIESKKSKYNELFNNSIEQS